MRVYDLDADSRSAHRTSAESMTTVNGPSGAVKIRIVKQQLVGCNVVNRSSYLALPCSK
jgi:hypothetical protein